MAPPKLPMTCGEVVVHDFGKVEPHKSGYHDEEFIYPVGFRSSRKYLSVVNPAAKCLYYSEVVEGPDGEPIFRVTCEQDKSEPIEDKSADAVWSVVLERITSLTRRSSRAGAMPSSANRGAEMYGLTFDKARKAIMDLPGATECSKLRANIEARHPRP
ncbi:F/Y rich C-terminus-domain-containing protein [Baffinella frigidus]|nr:F/Y rich C-terminus-domain-containing protein [Cryptophyta sp. CCMP2293]